MGVSYLGCGEYIASILSNAHSITDPRIHLPQAYSCWGALLAAPERDADGKLHRFTLRSVVSRPLLANLICLLLPLAQSISVIVPAVLSDAKGERALNDYLAWEQKYENATSIDRDMLLEGADIYNRNLDAIYYACIGFSLWSFWAFSFFLIYTKIVYGLFLDIMRHTKLLRSNLPSESVSWKTKLQRSLNRASVSRESASDMEKMNTSSDHGRSSNPRALVAADDYTLGSGRNVDGDEEMSSSRRRNRDALQAEMPMATETLHIFSRQEVAEDLPNTSFFPPVKPSKVLPPQNLTGTSSRAAHAKLFRRLLVNFGFQFAGICVAVLVYLAIALFLAIEFYASLEANNAGSTAGPAVLAAFWAASVFGSVTLFAIALRTYEQAVPAGAVSNPTRETPRFNAGAFTVPPEPSTAKSPTMRSKPRFTRATKKATEIAADQTIGGSDRDSSIEEPIEDLPRAYPGGSIAMTRVNPSRKDRSDISADEAERFEHLSETNAVTQIDHFQYSKEPVPAHKLLTPEDFQRKDRARHVSSPSSPPDETPLSATMNGPLAPSTRVRHAHQNSLKSNSLAQARNGMPHQEPWNDTPQANQSADTSLRPSLDAPQGEASRRDDSDIE